MNKMNKFKYEYVQMMEIKSLLILVLSVLIAFTIYGSQSNIVQAQETKGGGSSSSGRVFSSSSSSSIKGGAGFSSFRQNLASVQQQNQFRQQIQQQQNFQRQEEQVIQQPIQPSTVQISNILSSSSVFQRPILTNQQQVTTNTNSRFVEEQRENIVQQQQQSQQTDSEPAVYGSVSGVPGIDFPGYTTIPNTPFSCESRPFDPGMYADESTGCQVYHLCYQGRRESFLCGIGTVFNQAIMNCDFWHAVDCSKSSEYYHLNSEFGKASAEGGGSQVVNNFAKQEISSRFSSNQIQVQPTPILSSKTNFVGKQQFSTNQLVVPPRPKLASSTSFSRVETSSKSIEPQIYNGKTSIRKEEQIFRNSQNSLSPSRQVQFNQRNQIDQNFIEPNQQSLESSNQFKVVNGIKQTFSPSGNGKASTALFDIKQKTGNTFGIKGGSNEISQPEQNDDSVWKPYFKSKSAPKNQISSQTTSDSRPTVDMSTNEVSSTVSLPDQEPSFGRPSANGDGVVSINEQPKVPKGSAPYETTTTATATTRVVEGSSETNSNSSIEPDVSPALTSTSPTPEVLMSTEQSSPTSLGPASSSSNDESAVSTETTTTPKTSSQEETTTTPTPASGNGDENDFGSRSSRSSGEGSRGSNSSGLVLTHSSVEYESNEPAERNKTTRS